MIKSQESLQLTGVINIRNSEYLLAFGKNLRKIRNEKLMSQEELAFNADIPISQVGRIERGEVNTTISTVLKLSVALGIKPIALFDFEFKVSE